MKKIKIIATVMCILVVVIASAISFVACNGTEDEDMTLELYVPDGAPVLAVAYLVANPDLEIAGYTINVNIVTATEIASKMADRSGDIVIMPANTGANLILKGAEYKFFVSNTQGILYLIGKEEETVTLDSLGQKEGTIKIGSMGEGAVPQYAVETVFSDTDKFDVTYYADAAAVKAALEAGQIDYGVVAEPAATASASTYPIVMSIQDAFAEVTESESGFPMSSTFVKSSLASDTTFMDAFKEVLEYNLTYINEHASEMTELLQSAGSTSSYPVAAIPNCNVGVYMDEELMETVKAMLKFFDMDTEGVYGIFYGYETFVCVYKVG